MSYLYKEPQTFFNVKLTDAGRRLLSLGQLTFDQAVFSDREINYGVARNSASYCIPMNRILRPKDDQPFLPNTNFDGSASYPLGTAGVFSSTEIVTAQTSNVGAWCSQLQGCETNVSGSVFETDYIHLNGVYKNSGTTTIAAINSANKTISASTASQVGEVGDLLVLRTYAQTGTYDAAPETSRAPLGFMTFRIQSVAGEVMTLDREPPTLGTGNQVLPFFTYAKGEVEALWGSGTTKATRVWNMNIVRTSSEIGTNSSVSGYTSYGSLEYNGTKQYLGFEEDYRSIGIVHYTNLSSGNTYAEQLVAGTVKLDIPHVMWHHTASDPGTGTVAGLRLTDEVNVDYYDEVAQTTFRYLRDGSAESDNIVGRVYHKLKIFVITDPELLTALTYKSNRNWTLPKPNVRLVDNPAAPLTTANASGLCRTDYLYAVTYRTDNLNAFNATSSLGYQPNLHCGYVQIISGETESNGLSKYLNVSFPAGSFPYLRNQAGFATYSGTGWSTNRVQLMVQEIKATNFKNINSLPTDEWKLIGLSSTTTNGIYTGETGQNTIDATNLQAHQFIISKEDYDSGTTYALGSHFTDGYDRSGNGLTLGDETFFFGNIEAAVRATVFKTVINLVVTDTELNSSENSTFDASQDNETYVSEIGILNADNVLVAVGKPSYPLEKSSARFLTYQLQLDF